MYKNSIIIIGLLINLPIYADVDMQKGVYDSAEEIIEFDEKMNRVIAEHNMLDPEDAKEASMVEDFKETKSGYVLTRDILDVNNTKVDVKLEKGILTISMSTTEKEEIAKGAISGYQSIKSSSIVSLFIPHNADENKMQKSYKNGVLEIRFPKK